MSALRILLVFLVLLGAGLGALIVMGSNLEPTVTTVEVTLPDDTFTD